MTRLSRWSLLAAFLLPACGGADDPATGVGVDSGYEFQLGEVDCNERDPALDWDNFAEGFFQQFCMGCHSANLTGADRHSAPDGVNFNTPDDVAQWSERIRIRSLDQGDMPPGGGPTDELKHELDEFLTCGL